MRQRFFQQITLGITPIPEVVIPKNSRHELAPVLLALQHIFVTPDRVAGAIKRADIRVD